MTKKSDEKFRKELNTGAISLLLLSLIHEQGEPMYGYEIGELLSQRSEQDLPMNQGAIYPVLRSLEKQGLLRSKRIRSSSGPPRKYYSLTAGGKKSLRAWTGIWHQTTGFVNSFLESCNADQTEDGHRKVSQ